MKRIILTVVLGIVLGIAAANTAHAADPNQCNTGNYCLNLWNGVNGAGFIKAYVSGANNEDISIQALPGRCNAIDGYDSDDYQTTTSCPISGGQAGNLIFQLVGSWGQCIGDYNGSSGDARGGGFDGCNSTLTGFGGAYGTVFFAFSSSCPNGYNLYQSFHWLGGGIGYNDINGSQSYLNVSQATCLIEG